MQFEVTPEAQKFARKFVEKAKDELTEWTQTQGDISEKFQSLRELIYRETTEEQRARVGLPATLETVLGPGEVVIIIIIIIIIILSPIP
jgi:hypothetical protein